MATSRQLLGTWGEKLVAKSCGCPKCKRSKTLKLLPPNFKCADLICDFCGFLGQVKTMTVPAVSPLPKQILGAAWGPQKERMDSGIYFPLFLVLKAPTNHAIYYLPTDFQSPALFSARKPLSSTARRAGWQGFMYVLGAVPDGAFVRLA
ncbi:DpnI domain-containing protein [Castellaniella sp.]|uniref:DpnI domain-containing protein n=1 Tax=Castellaniella sp. TaxID=1955812 RepID=UPI003C76BA3E